MSELAPVPPPKGRRLALRVLLGAAITGALVYTLSRYVDWPRLRALFAARQWSWLGGCFAVYCVLYVVRALRFWLLARELSFGRMYLIICVHNVLLRLMPMRTGDLSYAILLKRAFGATTEPSGAGDPKTDTDADAEADANSDAAPDATDTAAAAASGDANTRGASIGRGVMSLLLIRILDVGGVVLLFAITLALNQGVYRGDTRVGFIGAGVVAALGVAGVVFFRPLLSLLARLARAVARLFRLDSRPRIARTLDRLDAEIDTYARVPGRTIGWLIAATLVAWLLNFVIVFAIMRGFSIKVSAAQAVLGGTAAVVSGFLPVGGIGSFGALEAGWTLGFVLVGLQTPVAVASAFGFSIVTLIYALILGVVGWIGLGVLARKTLPRRR